MQGAFNLFIFIVSFDCRLRAMAYVGFFDDLLRTTMPLINAVLECSEVLINSKNVRKVGWSTAFIVFA